jgi:hypothetical protein
VTGVAELGERVGDVVEVVSGPMPQPVQPCTSTIGKRVVSRSQPGLPGVGGEQIGVGEDDLDRGVLAADGEL